MLLAALLSVLPTSLLVTPAPTAVLSGLLALTSVLVAGGLLAVAAAGTSTLLSGLPSLSALPAALLLPTLLVAVTLLAAVTPVLAGVVGPLLGPLAAVLFVRLIVVDAVSVVVPVRVSALVVGVSCHGWLVG